MRAQRSHDLIGKLRQRRDSQQQNTIKKEKRVTNPKIHLELENIKQEEKVSSYESALDINSSVARKSYATYRPESRIDSLIDDIQSRMKDDQSTLEKI